MRLKPEGMPASFKFPAVYATKAISRVSLAPTADGNFFTQPFFEAYINNSYSLLPQRNYCRLRFWNEHVESLVIVRTLTRIPAWMHAACGYSRVY